MILAVVDGDRRTATPGARARCPSCSAEVIAKCGSVNIWHWAHTATDCDPWSEPATRWHLDWQERFPPHTREVTLGPHRADVRLDSGLVLEFQHSPLPVADIAARENFYGRMVWIFDAVEAVNSGRLDLRRKPEYVTFRWKHPRRSLLACSRPVYLDIGGGELLHLRKLGTSAPYGGWGYTIPAGSLLPALRAA